MVSPPSAAVSTFCGRTTVTGTLQCNTNSSIATNTDIVSSVEHHICCSNRITTVLNQGSHTHKPAGDL